ncbi:ATP-binding protein [Streptomyces sp. NPDC057474]|uniref:ATP-binding protein n=1 Tax=Streptomyces sp. NPDC057474 TaxID=3346144 RepID=UPI0036A5A80D
MIPPPAPLGTDAAGDRVGPGPAAGARPETIAERRFRFELAAHPGAVAQARRVTRTQLTGWALCEDTCDTAALVVSELVTNAIVHTASTQIVCELHDGDELVRIAVRDEGCAPGEPHPSPQRPEEEHGRGLLLIESLCRSWGAQPVGLGLLVWADVPRGLLTGAASPDLGASTVTSLTASTDTAARSDLGWGAKKPPTEDRDGEAEAFRLASADGRRSAEALMGADGRAAAGGLVGAECRTEVEVRPEVGRRAGAEWV